MLGGMNLDTAETITEQMLKDYCRHKKPQTGAELVAGVWQEFASGTIKVKENWNIAETEFVELLNGVALALCEDNLLWNELPEIMENSDD
jgi:hypothetical protein